MPFRFKLNLQKVLFPIVLFLLISGKLSGYDYNLYFITLPEGIIYNRDIDTVNGEVIRKPYPVLNYNITGTVTLVVENDNGDTIFIKVDTIRNGYVRTSISEGLVRGGSSIDIIEGGVYNKTSRNIKGFIYGVDGRRRCEVLLKPGLNRVDFDDNKLSLLKLENGETYKVLRVGGRVVNQSHVSGGLSGVSSGLSKVSQVPDVLSVGLNKGFYSFKSAKTDTADEFYNRYERISITIEARDITSDREFYRLKIYPHFLKEARDDTLGDKNIIIPLIPKYITLSNPRFGWTVDVQMDRDFFFDTFGYWNPGAQDSCPYDYTYCSGYRYSNTLRNVYWSDEWPEDKRQIALQKLDSLKNYLNAFVEANNLENNVPPEITALNNVIQIFIYHQIQHVD